MCFIILSTTSGLHQLPTFTYCSPGTGNQQPYPIMVRLVNILACASRHHCRGCWGSMRCFSVQCVHGLWVICGLHTSCELYSAISRYSQLVSRWPYSQITLEYDTLCAICMNIDICLYISNIYMCTYTHINTAKCLAYARVITYPLPLEPLPSWCNPE